MFGGIDDNQVVDGMDGFTYFSNLGFDEWALQIDHLHYDGIHTNKDSEVHMVHTKIAVIDSGNSSIQIPYSQFKVIQARMLVQESSLQEKEVESEHRIMLYSSKKCEDLEASFGNLEFQIQNTKVTISPKGYLYEVEDTCYIGIEAIPDKVNHYRLGNVFLRNFYTVLNYEKNIIMLGLNKDGAAAESAAVNGKSAKPIVDKRDDGSNGLVVFFIVMAILVLVGALGFFLWKKRQSLKTPFAKTTVARKDEEKQLAVEEFAPEEAPAEALLDKEENPITE